MCCAAYLFTCGAWCNCRDNKDFVLSIKQFHESHVCLSLFRVKHFSAANHSAGKSSAYKARFGSSKRKEASNLKQCIRVSVAHTDCLYDSRRACSLCSDGHISTTSLIARCRSWQTSDRLSRSETGTCMDNVCNWIPPTGLLLMHEAICCLTRLLVRPLDITGWEARCSTAWLTC